MSRKAINKHLISKDEFNALLETASKCASKEEAHTKVWFTIANQILADWDGISYRFLNSLTPGQYAVTCSAEFFRGVKGADIFAVLITSEELPELSLKAFEILKAKEYLELLKDVKSAFPKKQFPKYSEDLLMAIRKTPYDFLEAAGEKFAKARGMERPLHEYVFSFVTAHPKDFCTANSNSR